MSTLRKSKHLKVPLEEIKNATKNFQNCIGNGGYGNVYKGELLVDGKSTEVAVKRLKEEFGQGLKEFLIEIQLLTGQKHPNLISLVGYCDEGKEKIIVYEYAENGSLEKYLRRNRSTYVLNWLERLKICVDAARGLDHLHNHAGMHQTIIHRDIKSSNILLGHNFVAKISDFGLSKLSFSGLDRSLVISYACGTRGYCEPEYMSTGIVKKESDVYSFGMVLFEVLCGKQCFISEDDDDFLLSGPSAKDYYEKNKLAEIVDPILREQMSFESMNKFSTIAYQCLHGDRRRRPPIDHVMKELEELLQMTLVPSYALRTASKIRSYFDKWLGFDKTLQIRAGNAVNNLDDGVKEMAMSFDIQEEYIVEINEEEVKIVLDSKRGIWKSKKLVNLVEDYLETNMETHDLCDSLMTSLKRIRDTYLLIPEGLNQFDETTLDALKSFKAAGDPFTVDFFRIFNFVYRRQIAFLEELQRKKVKLYKEFDQSTTRGYSFYRNEQDRINEQKEVIQYIYGTVVL